MTGKVSSIQSLAALDGPGVRFAVFLAGCNLRCGYCHNPETQTKDGAKEYTAEALFKMAERYREYFGKDGGITLSGGEPLLQARFAREVFTLAKNAGINTCLDTSGTVINEEVEALLSKTDRVLLDIKFTSEEQYKEYTGGSLDAVLRFLDLLFEKGIKTTVRQVIIPTLNDSKESLLRLKSLTRGYTTIDSFEFLPFKKMCKTKYDNLGIPFIFDTYREPTEEEMKEVNDYFFSL